MMAHSLIEIVQIGLSSLPTLDIYNIMAHSLLHSCRSAIKGGKRYNDLELQSWGL